MVRRNMIKFGRSIECVGVNIDLMSIGLGFSGGKGLRVIARVFRPSAASPGYAAIAIISIAYTSLIPIAYAVTVDVVAPK